MQNNGCLYGVAPEAYITVSSIATKYKSNKPKFNENRGKNRHGWVGSDLRYYTGVFKKEELRIVTIGKWHVVYQRCSKHGDWGPEQTAKLIRKKKKIYFEVKNKKVYLRKANMVW